MDTFPGADDLPYLEAHFADFDRLAIAHGREPREVRAAIANRQLPQPTYKLADGRELVPPDYFALCDAAGGPERLRGWFAAVYEQAAAGEADADPPDVAWDDYLSGTYGACLRSVTPWTIVRKTVLVASLERLLAAPGRSDEEWLSTLRWQVDALDALERPFATFDRRRFGPVTRERLIETARAEFL